MSTWSVSVPEYSLWRKLAIKTELADGRIRKPKTRDVRSAICPSLTGTHGVDKSACAANPESSSRPIEQRSPAWNELEQDVVVGDVGGQNDQTELLCLQEQDAVLQRAQLFVLAVSLKPTQDA